jgi:hypothetical protein
LPCTRHERALTATGTQLTLRIFDRLFVDGIEVLLRVIVALYRTNQAAITSLTDPMAVLRIMDSAALCAFDASALLRARSPSSVPSLCVTVC